MATKRKKKVEENLKTPLPLHIELISNTTGTVQEFETEHAIRILQLQKKSGLGSYEIFNTELYYYDEGSRRIEHITQPRQSETSGGDSFIEPADTEQD